MTLKEKDWTWFRTKIVALREAQRINYTELSAVTGCERQVQQAYSKYLAYDKVLTLIKDLERKTLYKANKEKERREKDES
jgi:hypothetical protein